ncbi:MAG: hypothetical protein RLZZ466_231 [Bacteroidota bacterium]|jgi:methylated-DNA-protein-cysteine methyltransferase-like protein
MKRQQKTKETLQKILPSGNKENDFFHQVWELVRQIPKGRVTSYGAIAAALGLKSGARMVGWAMNSSHGQQPIVPAHRVVNRNGQLSGKNHFATPTLMQELLEKEGVRIQNDTIINFSQHFWDPQQES